MLKNTESITQKVLNRGLNTSKNFFSLQEGQSPACINIEFNKDSSVSKRLGTSTMNTTALESTGGYGMFDLGILGFGGIDANCQLMLHGNGVDTATTITDSSPRNYTVTALEDAQIDTGQSKFGGSSILLSGDDPTLVLLLHCDGTDTSTTFTDSATGKTVTAVGNAQIDTAQSKFGGASGLLDGTGDYLTVGDHADWNFGAGDFTIDCQLRFNSLAAAACIYSQGDATNNWFAIYWSVGGTLTFYFEASGVAKAYYTATWAPSTNTWYHFELVRNGTSVYIFIDGVALSLTTGTAISTNSVPDYAASIAIGYRLIYTDQALNGWIDEVRISKGIARHTANFTAPTRAYTRRGFLTIPDNSDWHFGLGDSTVDTWARFNSVLTSQVIIGQGSNSNNYWVWQYQSAPNSLVLKSYSGGSLVVSMSGLWSPNTSTWYHLALVRQTTTNWYMFVGGTALTVGGTNNGSIFDLVSPLKIGVNAVTTNNTYFNGWLDEFRVSKGTARWTSNFTIPSSEYFSDVIQERRLICASGTGIYFSQDIGKTWAVCQTNRTAAINYFSFVKDYVIDTNESYDKPQYWTGSNNVYFANISTATPTCKHSLSHQGFLILINESANKTGFYYIDQNSMFTSAFSSFKLPTDRNDELTAGFSLGRILYISSKYKIFRLLYLGGNPDWMYIEVRNFGFIPKTVKKINISGMGEVVIGMDWSKKVRVFDGSNDEVISDIVSEDNGITPFYLNNVNDLNLNKCWAEDDNKAQIYRLYLVYGGSSTVSYALNFNYRSGALYPDNNRPFQSGVLAKDTADTSHMLACDYNGRIHQLDSGNTDAGTAIDDSYVSPFLYRQTPSSVHKSQIIDLFFSVSSSGTVYYEDRNQFSNVWNLRKEMTLNNAISSLQIRHTIDIPESQNVYQYKLSSSSNTASPWQLNLADYELSGFGIGKP